MRGSEDKGSDDDSGGSWRIVATEEKVIITVMPETLGRSHRHYHT